LPAADGGDAEAALMTPAPVTKEMALTAADFRRGLAILFRDRAVAFEGERAVLTEDGRSLSIDFLAQEPRVLGKLMVLPRASITITFTGYGPTEADAFLAEFDRVFQRAGG
jgi:hypothetical protein